MTTLAKFLQAKEPLFDHALKQLEERAGNAGIDVKLAAEIAEKAAKATKALGLEPDCTGPELYSALINQVKQHDEHLARAIGGTDPDDLRQMIPLILAAIEKVDMPRGGFFIKEAVAAELLTQMPPKSVMQRLGHADIDNLLARENLYEIFLALRFAEDGEWLNQFNELYKTLTADDFEERDIRLVPFDAAKWGDIAEHFIQKKLHNITNSKEMGAIAVMPMTMERMKGVTLKVFPLILHYFNEIRLYSTFFKLVKNKQNFGEILTSTLIADPSHVSLTAGTKIHWRVIQRYFGKLKNENHPEIFEPHLQPEDLHWRKAEHTLYQIDPELEFWKDLDYVATMKPFDAAQGKGDEPVTFALMDISLSYSNDLSYEDRYLYHFRESLWNEVFARYMGENNLEEQLLSKLDNAIVAPEKLTV